MALTTEPMLEDPQMIEDARRRLMEMKPDGGNPPDELTPVLEQARARLQTMKPELSGPAPAQANLGPYSPEEMASWDANRAALAGPPSPRKAELEALQAFPYKPEDFALWEARRKALQAAPPQAPRPVTQTSEPMDLTLPNAPSPETMRKAEEAVEATTVAGGTGTGPVPLNWSKKIVHRGVGVFTESTQKMANTLRKPGEVGVWEDAEKRWANLPEVERAKRMAWLKSQTKGNGKQAFRPAAPGEFPEPEPPMSTGSFWGDIAGNVLGFTIDPAGLPLLMATGPLFAPTEGASFLARLAASSAHLGVAGGAATALKGGSAGEIAKSTAWGAAAGIAFRAGGVGKLVTSLGKSSEVGFARDMLSAAAGLYAVTAAQNKVNGGPLFDRNVLSGTIEMLLFKLYEKLGENPKYKAQWKDVSEERRAELIRLLAAKIAEDENRSSNINAGLTGAEVAARDREAAEGEFAPGSAGPPPPPPPPPAGPKPKPAPGTPLDIIEGKPLEEPPPPPPAAPQVAPVAQRPPEPQPSAEAAPKPVELPVASPAPVAGPETAKISWGKRQETWPERVREIAPDEYLKRTGNGPLDRENIERLKSAMQKGEEIKSVSLRLDADSGKVIEQEGRHRAQAAKELGVETIPVYVSTWRAGKPVGTDEAISPPAPEKPKFMTSKIRAKQRGGAAKREAEAQAGAAPEVPAAPEAAKPPEAAPGTLTLDQIEAEFRKPEPGEAIGPEPVTQENLDRLTYQHIDGKRSIGSVVRDTVATDQGKHGRLRGIFFLLSRRLEDIDFGNMSRAKRIKIVLDISGTTKAKPDPSIADRVIPKTKQWGVEDVRPFAEWVADNYAHPELAPDLGAMSQLAKAWVEQQAPAAAEKPAAPTGAKAEQAPEIAPKAALGTFKEFVESRGHTWGEVSGKGSDPALYEKLMGDYQNAKTASASATPTGKAKVPTIPSVQKTQGILVAGKFRNQADALQKSIDHLRREMTQNPTPKRMREYRTRLHEADNLERVQKAMRALADAHENGTISEGLRDIRKRDDILKLVQKYTSSNAGYYDVIPLQDYANKSAPAVELQNMIEKWGDVQADAERAKQEQKQKVDQLTAEVQFQKIPGFFPTPAPVAERMAEILDAQPGMTVLDPSAGKGDLLEAVLQQEPDAKVNAIEIVPKLADILKAKDIPVDNADFLEQSGQYDRIVMNPPFEGGQDMDHVRHAYDLLEPGGKLVAIMSEGSFSRGDKKAVAFREWFYALPDATEEKLENAFKGGFRPTGVASRLVVIEKPLASVAPTGAKAKLAKIKAEKGKVVAAPPAAKEKPAEPAKQGPSAAERLVQMEEKDKAASADMFGRTEAPVAPREVGVQGEIPIPVSGLDLAEAAQKEHTKGPMPKEEPGQMDMLKPGSKPIDEMSPDEFAKSVPAVGADSEALRSKAAMKLRVANKYRGKVYVSEGGDTHASLMTQHNMDADDVIPGFVDEKGRFLYQHPKEAHKMEIDQGLREGRAFRQGVLKYYPEMAEKWGIRTIADIPVTQAPTNSLKVDPGSLQFKGNVDARGVQEGEAIDGLFNQAVAKDLLVWQDKDGQLWVVNGHHRFALAQDSGTKTLDVRIMREEDGFSKKAARIIGAEANILDGTGTELDYAEFFRLSDITEEEAKRRGLLARDKGKRGFALGKKSTQNLFDQVTNGAISTENAVAIVEVAPNNEALQNAAIMYATEPGKRHPSKQDLRNFLLSLSTGGGTHVSSVGEDLTGDMFGKNDSVINLHIRLAKEATRVQQKLAERIAAVQGAAKRPELAGEQGVKVKNPKKVLEEIQRLKSEQHTWDHWETHPELAAELRKRIGISDNEPLLSIGRDTRPGGGMPVAEVQGLVDALAAKAGRLPASLTVYATPDDAPAGMNPRARGFYVPGRNDEPGHVGIIASNNDSPAEVLETYTHEVIKHFGLRGVFPNPLAFNAFLDTLYRERGGEIQKWASGQGIGVRKADTPEGQAKAERTAAEEWLAGEFKAGRGGANVPAPLWKRVLDALRAFVRRLGRALGFRDRVKFGGTADADLEALLRRAAEYVEGKPTEGAGEKGVVRAPGRELVADEAMYSLKPGPEEGKAGEGKEEKKPRVELPKYAEKSAINLKRLDTTDDVKQYLNDVTARLAVKINKHSVSWEETRKMAEELGWNTEDVKRQWDKNHVFTSAQIEATRQMNLNAISDLADTIKTLPKDRAALTPELRAQVLDAMSLVEVTSKAASEAGRALNIHRKILAKDPAFTEAAQLNRVMKELVGAGVDRTDAIIEALTQVDLTNAAEVNHFIRKTTRSRWEKLTDAAFEIYINGLLSNPLTHIVNTTSNALTLAYVQIEHPVAATIEAIRASVTKTPREMFFKEATEDLYSIVRALQSGARRAYTTHMQGEDVSKLDYPPSALPKKIRPFLPSTAMISEDAFFKGFIETRELSRLIFRKVRKEGLKGDALRARLIDLEANPTPELLEQAAEKAKYLTYQKALGEIGNSIMKFRNTVPSLRYFIPFVKTPANIAKFALERTPLNVPRILFMARAGKLKGGALSEELAKAILGSLFGILTYMFAEAGFITGGSPEKKAEREERLNTGWQPYSLNLGEHYYSFARLEPIASIIGLSADMNRIKNEMNENEKFNVAGAIVGSITSNISNKTFMQGFSNIIQALSDPGRYGANFIENTLGSVVPSVSAGVARSVDPIVRDAQGVIDRIETRIPGLSQTLPPKLTVWGDPVERAGSGIGRFLSPMQISAMKGSPIERELVNLNLNIGLPGKTIAGVTLSQDEYWDLVQSAGVPAKKALNKIVLRPSWKRLSNDEKERIIKPAIEAYRDIARKKMAKRMKIEGRFNMRDPKEARAVHNILN